MHSHRKTGLRYIAVGIFVAVLVSSCGGKPELARKTPQALPSPSVHVAGLVISSKRQTHPAYWLDNNLTQLPNQGSAEGADMWSIGEDSGQFYIYGAVFAYSLIRPSYWLDGKRFDLEKGQGYISFAQRLGGTVYMAGRIEKDGVSYPALWKDGKARELPFHPGASDGVTFKLNGMSLQGTDVLVAGFYFNDLGVQVPTVWSETSETELPVLDRTQGGEATAIAVLGADVYVAGASFTMDHRRIPCVWKNGVRQDLAAAPGQASLPSPPSSASGAMTFIPAGSGEPSGIAVDEYGVYAAGYTLKDGRKSPCVWKDGVRSDLEDLISGEARTVVPYGDQLYVSGYIIPDSDGVDEPCYWKNGERFDLPVLDRKAGGLAQAIYLQGPVAPQ